MVSWLNTVPILVFGWASFDLDLVSAGLVNKLALEASVERVLILTSFLMIFLTSVDISTRLDDVIEQQMLHYL